MPNVNIKELKHPKVQLNPDITPEQSKPYFYKEAVISVLFVFFASLNGKLFPNCTLYQYIAPKFNLCQNTSKNHIL